MKISAETHVKGGWRWPGCTCAVNASQKTWHGATALPPAPSVSCCSSFLLLLLLLLLLLFLLLLLLPASSPFYFSSSCCCCSSSSSYCPDSSLLPYHTGSDANADFSVKKSAGWQADKQPFSPWAKATKSADMRRRAQPSPNPVPHDSVQALGKWGHLGGLLATAPGIRVGHLSGAPHEEIMQSKTCVSLSAFASQLLTD